MGLFSGMDKFGLGKYKDTSSIIEEKKVISADSKVDAEVNQKTPEERESEVLFDKRFTCPVCDMSFVAKCVRAGKIKIIDKDMDLRPIYEFMDPLKYDVIACDKCGYSSLSRYFGKLSSRQMKTIHEQVGMSFRGLDSCTDDIYSYDYAITRYKLALICSMVKQAKNGERAYTCLKLAWVIRGKRLTLDPQSEEFKELYKDELECVQNAYEGFVRAISSEQFPIAGMDENTLKYVLSDLARRLKKHDEAIKLLGDVITSKTTNNRLKEEALKLKEIIKEEVNKKSAFR